MYQSITLVGNVGADPEMRLLNSGTNVTEFRMAVNKSWTSQDGQKNAKTLWFTVVCWRKLAEVVATYVKKGGEVLVVGEVEEAEVYVNGKGDPVSKIKITAQTVKFLGGRGDKGDGHHVAEDLPGMQGLKDLQDIPF